MTHGSRLQQVNRMVLEKVREVRVLGDEPTAENCELAQVWLRAVAKIAATQIKQRQISSLLRDVSNKKKQLLKDQASERVEAGLRESQLRERADKAAASMLSPLSADESTWLPDARAGNRFVTTAVRELPDDCIELDESVHVLTNMHIMGQLCQSQSDGGIRSLWILASMAGLVTEKVNLKSPPPC